jgi:hypothetical protein
MVLLLEMLGSGQQLSEKTFADKDIRFVRECSKVYSNAAIHDSCLQ